MIRKFFALTLIVFTAIALSGVAAHAAEDPHVAPVWTCGQLQFDPLGPTKVTVQTQVDGVTTEQTGTYAPDPGGIVTVPLNNAGKAGQERASLPDVYPGVWTAWHAFDCRTPDLHVTVTCGGSSVFWTNVHDPITVTVTYPTGPDVWTADPGNGDGGADHSHPLLYSQHVTVHATAGTLVFNDALDLTTGCSTPPVTTPLTTPPATTPAVPVTTPVIATGPGKPGDLATTGSYTDEIALIATLITALGFGLVFASNLKRRVR